MLDVPPKSDKGKGGEGVIAWARAREGEKALGCVPGVRVLALFFCFLFWVTPFWAVFPRLPRPWQDRNPLERRG